MGIDEAVEIIKSMRPGCGEKPTYTEGELCKAYDMACLLYTSFRKGYPRKRSDYNWIYR